jgi:hypothetical protein
MSHQLSDEPDLSLIERVTPSDEDSTHSIAGALLVEQVVWR